MWRKTSCANVRPGEIYAGVRVAPVKQDASPGDIAWVEAHTFEYPELRVEQQPQRRYPADGSLAHVLGYVGEISPEQLKQQVSKDKGLKPGDIIGLSGLEQIYDDYLRGTDGYREVVVDSRGRIQAEIEIVERRPAAISSPRSISICNSQRKSN